MLDSKKDVHNRITYTGQQYDGITGQYYLRARFYNPIIGRFTQEDTYRGDGLNLYAYCGNNPVGYYDPSGYSSYNKERPSALPEGTPPLGLPAPKVAGEVETVVNPNNKLNSILDMIKNGKKTVDGRNIVYQIDDNTKIMFRLDVGKNAHAIGDYGYPTPVNHGNIEIQAANAKGKYQTKWDYHLIFDENGGIDKRFETGKWTEWTK